MNTSLRFLATTLALSLFSVPQIVPAQQMTRLDSEEGKVRLEGTSGIHDWSVDGKLIAGFMETGENFPVEPGQSVKPGKSGAHVGLFIPVRSLKSGNSTMDNRMYKELKIDTNPKIFYTLSELVLKEPPKSKDAPYILDSQGELAVAGMTNKISMPVNITPLGDKKVKITGNITIKMTDFHVGPVNFPLTGGLIKVGDDVKIFFEWTVGPKSSPAAATKQ